MAAKQQLLILVCHGGLYQGLKLKLFRGPNEDLWSNPRAAYTALTQHWLHLNLTRNI